MALELGKEAGAAQRRDTCFGEGSSVVMTVELGLKMGTLDKSQHLKCREEEVKHE